MSKHKMVNDKLLQMEAILDEATAKMDALEEQISEYKAFQSDIKRLEEY